jgi:hypothetical protein
MEQKIAIGVLCFIVGLALGSITMSSPDPVKTYLHGKTWINDRRGADGVPIHTEVSINNSNVLSLKIVCGYSTVDRGDDVSVSVQSAIGNVTKNNFQMLETKNQTQANTKGFTCNVATKQGGTSYDAISESSLDMFGLNFTSACPGSK